jgi:hypothetical protein
MAVSRCVLENNFAVVDDLDAIAEFGGGVDYALHCSILLERQNRRVDLEGGKILLYRKWLLRRYQFAADTGPDTGRWLDGDLS